MIFQYPSMWRLVTLHICGVLVLAMYGHSLGEMLVSIQVPMRMSKVTAG